MSDLEEFEDWSHPTRNLMTLPRRRTRIHWLRLAIAAAVVLLLWGAWHVGHVIADAYRVVFGA
jgi:hypothetical protein